MKTKQREEPTSITLYPYEIEAIVLMRELAGADFGVISTYEEFIKLSDMTNGTIEQIAFERHAWMGKTRYRDFFKTVTAQCVGTRYIPEQDDKPERFMLLFKLWGRDAV